MNMGQMGKSHVVKKSKYVSTCSAICLSEICLFVSIFLRLWLDQSVMAVRQVPQELCDMLRSRLCLPSVLALNQRVNSQAR